MKRTALAGHAEEGGRRFILATLKKADKGTLLGMASNKGVGRESFYCS